MPRVKTFCITPDKHRFTMPRLGGRQPVIVRLAMVLVMILFCLTGKAATYGGNGNSVFGGPIGLGSVTLTDNSTTVSGTVNKGPNGFNDVLVIYIYTFRSGGFSNTTGFADNADGLRKAICGFDGGTNRSVLTFPDGFRPLYAIALG